MKLTTNSFRYRSKHSSNILPHFNTSTLFLRNPRTQSKITVKTKQKNWEIYFKIENYDKMSENNKENRDKSEEALTKLYFYEKNRLDSFKKWPHGEKSTCSILKVISWASSQKFKTISCLFFKNQLRSNSKFPDGTGRILLEWFCRWWRFSNLFYMRESAWWLGVNRWAMDGAQKTRTSMCLRQNWTRRVWINGKLRDFMRISGILHGLSIWRKNLNFQVQIKLRSIISNPLPTPPIITQ